MNEVKEAAQALAQASTTDSIRSHITALNELRKALGSK